MEELAKVEDRLGERQVIGLELRVIEDVVDEREEVRAGISDVGDVVAAPIRSTSRMSKSSANPMMVLSGVRSLWLMVARKRDLASLAISALRCASSKSMARRCARSTVFSRSAVMVPIPR
jgi:hypothetical protein